MESLLATSLWIAYFLLAAAFGLVFVRLVRGPSLPDRIVAVDSLSYIAVAFVALIALDTGEAVYMDAALVLALLAFLATIAFARYVAWRGARDTSASKPAASSAA